MPANGAANRRFERGLAPLLIAVAGLVLLGYLVAWAGLDRMEIGRSDFTSTYVGATLWRSGHHQDLYDPGVQGPLHAAEIAPDHERLLPFLNPPTAAVLAAPVTVLGLVAAYRVWSLLQLGLLIASVVVAARAAPGRIGRPRFLLPAAVLLGAAGSGTENLVLLGQWDGLCALGLALGYLCLRRGDRAAAGMTLAIGLTLAKPHLALGLAAWMVGRADRRLLAGAAAGVAAVVAACLIAVGPAGSAGFVQAALSSTTRWALRSLLGFSGLFGSWLGDTVTSHLLAGAASIGACVACGWLGWAGRHAPDRLEQSLGAAVALSLVAAPHLLGQDLVLLAPMMVAMLLAADSADRREPRPRPGPSRSEVVIVAWLLFHLIARLDFGNSNPAPPGRLVPLALLAAGVAGVVALRGVGGAPTQADARP